MRIGNATRILKIHLSVLCLSMLSAYLLAPAQAARNEETVAFTNDEPEIAFALAIKLSRAFDTKPGHQKTGNTATANTQSADGLHITTFTTEQGKIRVYLPDDMMAGDTISGTVITEPAGSSDEERFRNKASLEGYVVEFAGLKASAAKPNFSWVVARTQAPARYVLRLVEVRGGSTVNGDPLPLGPVTSPVPAKDRRAFVVPALGQAGRLVEIAGPFDGNSANTTLRFGPALSTMQDFDKNVEGVGTGFGLLSPLAESPRKVVFQSPTSVTGPLEIMVKEGTVATTAAYRNVGVRLSAPKTTLLRGERTTLSIEAVGLEGIMNDIPLQLETSGVIQIDGGNSQSVTIHPAEIRSGGHYSTTREITAQQAGAFSCTATVLVQPGLSHDVKSKDELLVELQDLRERKKYDCDHGREYQQAFADRIAVIKRVLRSFHNQHILNDPIDENCPPK